MRVVVVGAGLAGLVAARELHAAGVDVIVIDKGRSVGGRLATRRIGDATVDHGAQFFTVRTPAFASRVDDWTRRGLVRVWNHGFDDDDGHPRHVGVRGMNALAKDLADGLHVECSTMAFAVRPGPDDGDHPWEVAIDDGTVRVADVVVLTCPLPQSFALLADSGVELERRLFGTEYDRTIALLAVVDGPTALPSTGGIQHADDVFGFIADNQHKGVSARPALTFHATPSWSEAHWDDADDLLVDALTEAAGRWLGGAAIVDRQLKKWRLATPRTIWPDPIWATAGGRVVLAGDAFAGPRMEGAHNSGLAAAHHLVG